MMFERPCSCFRLSKRLPSMATSSISSGVENSKMCRKPSVSGCGLIGAMLDSVPDHMRSKVAIGSIAVRSWQSLSERLENNCDRDHVIAHALKLPAAYASI